jgi:hypothetical protein
MRTVYRREQGCGDSLFFFEAKRGPGEKNFIKHGVTGKNAMQQSGVS